MYRCSICTDRMSEDEVNEPGARSAGMPAHVDCAEEAAEVSERLAAAR